MNASTRHFPDMAEANRRFGQVFITLAQRDADMRTFRHLSETGMPLAVAHQTAVNRRFVERMSADGDLDRFFVSRDAALAFYGGTEGLATELTSSQIAAYQKSVDIASIVFAHSAVDAAVGELCWVIAFAEPDDWDCFLEARKVSLSDVKAKSVSEIRADVLAAYLSQLERESLLVRVDRLFMLCQPSRDWEGIRGFRFDRERIERLDVLRHAIVHHEVDPEKLLAASDDIDYLFKAGMHVWAMVHAKYGVQIDVRNLLPASVREALEKLAADAL